MEDIFGQKPMVKPIAIASSLAVADKRSAPGTSQSSNEKQSPQKRKLN